MTGGFYSFNTHTRLKGLWIKLWISCGKAVDRPVDKYRPRQPCGKLWISQLLIHRHPPTYPQNYPQAI